MLLLNLILRMRFVPEWAFCSLCASQGPEAAATMGRMALNPARQMYANPSSGHRYLGMTHSASFVSMSDSARLRLNLYVVAKPVAVAQTS